LSNFFAQAVILTPWWRHQLCSARLTPIRVRLIALTVLCTFSIAVSILQAAQVVDAQLRWVGGMTLLVSLGDLLDRAPQSLKAMDLLMRLQEEARSSGGYVHVLLGNHEVMNLTGDLRDVSDEEDEALNRIGGSLE